VRPIAGYKKEHPRLNKNALKEMSKAATTGNKFIERNGLNI